MKESGAPVDRSDDESGRITPKSLRPRCGARTRAGGPCRAPAVWDHHHDRPHNGRCRMHGGLSTGPRTAAGRRRIAAAMRQRWAAWRAALRTTGR